MKNMLLIFYLIMIFIFNIVLASPSIELQNRLNKINSFYASFIQTVTTIDGILVQRNIGDIWVQRPNLFHCHIHLPDESIFISDGITLWFYTPLVEQVSAIWLDKCVENTPLMLIMRNDINTWSQYHIDQTNDSFYLTPNNQLNNLKAFSISISPIGIISNLITVNQDGLRNIYIFSNHKYTITNINKFQFSIPSGVMVDDQRQ
ncbi:Outer-membrane lipoprotein carrier protein [Candidatus Profftia lariciata]|uniref:outer membrane lipoprotein chaperone LolA n=1 Tax=Candidatus Profftia lariciata TaxID=1987921 RepID=UPI001D01155D|nr:outer membrane lipoprotein chaperone LolA [Candidatus Profftia lariciata]UDG81246.1 Outer-membrane lipoprotein carrier protein [Candidatus Profftia lariciata]